MTLHSPARRRLLLAGLSAPIASRVWAQGDEWARVEHAARGQTVRFNAWAGSEHINAYL